jgi:2-aminoadipate transaminase
MAFNPLDFYSENARSGPPMFFTETNLAAYNFDQGLAARETFPTQDLMRLAHKVLEKDGPTCLDYFSPSVGYEELVFGSRALRKSLAERTHRIQGGRKFDHQGVILTSGSVQAISLACNGFINRGDIAAVEAVTFPYALRYIKSAGADVRVVPIDRNGMDVDALEELCDKLAREGKKLKFVYLGPTFHCPTGAELSLERRVKLVKLAQKHGFLILEDDVYTELRFEGEKLPTLLSLDDSGLVMQAGTFSKMVMPGIRLGWMVGDPRTIGGLAAVRQDLGVSQFIARIMEEYLAEGALESHIVDVNKIYKAKRDAAVDGLKAQRGDLLRFETPRGSFYLWIEIDDRVDWSKVVAEAEKAGIHFRPGERFLAGNDQRQFFRMSYSQEPLERVREGARRLGEIIQASVRAKAA